MHPWARLLDQLYWLCLESGVHHLHHFMRWDLNTLLKKFGRRTTALSIATARKIHTQWEGSGRPRISCIYRHTKGTKESSLNANTSLYTLALKNNNVWKDLFASFRPLDLSPFLPINNCWKSTAGRYTWKGYVLLMLQCHLLWLESLLYICIWGNYPHRGY